MKQSSPSTANFDLVARPYRWMEYLTFGLALQRCRTYFLAQLAGRRSALVFGDGDGRFLACLLASNPQLTAEAVDSSQSMLRLLQGRVAAIGASARLRTSHADALSFVPERMYDVVAAHFFVDCLTQPELTHLVSNVTPHLEPGALWAFSDFHVPEGPMRWPARVLIRSLYLAFRLLTGLRTTRLPDHGAALASAGFTCVARHNSLAGLLTGELWAYTPAMQLPPQRPRTHIPDPVPDPEPASPSLPEPDPGVFHHEPGISPPHPSADPRRPSD
jgi:ubiquinone/menaquinone biosynthesis C-methylase UbiE